MTDRITAVAVLADPVRRRLYEYVVSCGEPVGREQAAAGAGCPPHSARFHLDRLVRAGLLEAEYRRLTGRSGPGAGRPAKLYRRSAAEVAVTIPPRSYDLVGAVLADAVERGLAGEALPHALAAAARERGHGRGREAAIRGADDARAQAGEGDELDRTAAVLAREGFEPNRAGDEVSLHNCPFDALAREHTELVCGVNLEYVTGVTEGLGCRRTRPRLAPAPDRCCVRIGLG